MSTRGNDYPTIVVGGGYAGVMAANRLAASGEQVTLVTARPYFVERIRLHRVAAGLREHARVEYDTILHASVRVVHGTAVRLHPGEHELDLADGTALRYAAVVLAVGAGADASDALAVTDEEAALRTRAALAAQPNAPVAVVGSGLTGIEAATALAAAGRAVTLHARAPLTGPEGVAFERRLRRLGARIAIDEAPASGSVVVQATGFHAQSLARDSGLPTDAAGLLLVSPDLSVPGVPDVYGAGDAVSLESTGWSHLRPACATATPLGAHVATSILARRAGRPAPSFTLGYVARCVDLADGIGRFQLVDRDDHALPFALPGVFGGWAKEIINRLTLRWMRGERRRAGSYRWASAPADASRAEIAPVR